MTEAVETTEVPLDGAETPVDEPTTFDADYVQGLKDEAIQNRHEAREQSQRGDALFERLKDATISQGTAGILRSADDLPADADIYDAETGFPSLEKVQAAAQALADLKPYLAHVAGDVKQGPQGTKPEPTFGELLRARVR